MAENKNIEVGGRLHSIATGNVIAGANEILDDAKGKKQSVINAENDVELASHESRLKAYTEGKFVTVSNYSALPDTGAVDTVYRVSSWDGTANNGQGAVDVTKYSEYAWQNGAYKFLDVKTQIGEVFDISEYNSGAVYTDLTNALGYNGINVPSFIRRGGMSVKFKQVITPATYTVVKTEGVTTQPIGTEIQSDPGIISGTYTAGELSVFSTLPATLNASLTYYLAVTETVDEQEVTTYTTWVITYVHTSDNKYVQYRCIAQGFTADISQWQGVVDTPTIGGTDIITSGGANIGNENLGLVYENITPTEHGYYRILPDGTKQSVVGQNWVYTDAVTVSKGDIVVLVCSTDISLGCICLTDSETSYFKPVAVSTNDGIKKSYTYYVKENGYISFAYYKTDLVAIRKVSASVLSQIIDTIPDKVIDDLLDISNKESVTIEQGISNTFIDSNGKKHAKNNYYISKKISVKAGEYLSITTKLPLGMPIMSKVYNEDYDYYKPLVTSDDSSSIKEYCYLVKEDCYVIFNYYQSDIPVVTRIRSESLTEALSLSIASGILNVGVTYLNPTWVNGYYYDAQGVKTVNARYRISTPISVCAGDKITAKAYFISGFPIAVYTDASGNTESVAFSADSTGNKEYTFYADRKGYISFSHFYDSNDNYYLYSYIIESQLVKKVVDRFYAIIQGVEATIPNKVLDDIADITEGESITIEVGKSGYVIDGSGSASASQNYSISKGIEVEAGDILTVRSNLATGLTLLAYQYGEDATYYSSLIISDSNSLKTYQHLVQKAGYVVLSYLTSTPPTVTRTRSATISKALTEADTNSEYLDVTKEYVSPTLTSGYLYFPDGSKVASSSFSVSSPVSVNAGDKIVVYLHNLSSPEMAVAVYTNADGSVNGANGLPLGSACNIDYNGYKVYTFIADRTGYISFCCYQSRFRYAYIIRSNALKDELSHIENGLINKDNETRFYALSDNPIERIQYTPGMTSIIRSWGFIGDSLASGVVNYNTPTSGTETLYDYSWGQMLCRLTGATGYNFSYGGQYAKRWITSLDEGTSYQREPERCWQGAKTNLKDAYIIALGENDMASLRDVYTEGSVSTDVGTYDPQTDTDTNANSFAGWMAGIIQRIQSVQPKAPIFLVTMPKRPAGQELRMAYNTVIRDLAEHFSNVYLIDVYTYGPDLYRDEYLKGMFFNSSHMNAIGYQWFSYLICTYIDWIIRHNPSAFRNQQFVGTNYSYSI